MPETRYSTVPDRAFAHARVMPERQRREVVYRMRRVLDWEHAPYTLAEDWDVAGGLTDAERDLCRLLTSCSKGVQRGIDLLTLAVEATVEGEKWDDAYVRKVELICMAQEVCQRSFDIALRELAKTGLVVIGDPHRVDPTRALADGVTA